jgi:hypothetical protein
MSIKKIGESIKKFTTRGKEEEKYLKMRNLICLGRTTSQILTDNSTDSLPITAITPLPSSENAFFVAQGPSSTNSEIQISQVEVYSLPHLKADS